MKVFIVFAHPELKSFNGSFMKATVEHLEKKGHEVRVSDLYREHFKCVVDEKDFLNFKDGDRLKVAFQSYLANSEGKLTEDVYRTQANLAWADLVIFQFPLWWYTMPAILKGWFERVYTCGYAYGVGVHDETHYGDRFGEGVMEGKKAILAVTVGGSKTHYSPRGINGPIDHILFPITHNILYYPGFTVLPSHITYETDKAGDKEFNDSLNAFLNTLDNIDTVVPIAFRRQNFGDYEMPSLQLKEGLEQPNETGFDIHIKK
ncbi:NAD(P)H-dependent oxidoreductase PWA37_005221 [Arxiozyma heterogenica]|uniref:NAD(P)H-dependent oxidoreductase n=1 Tax=Arxiozyma heterogenica TaxID=278026 RepID=UPI002F017C79